MIQRKDGLLEERYTDPETGKRISFYGHSKSELKRKLTEYKDRREKGVTVNAGLDLWLAKKEKEVTYKIVLVDGEEESREALEEKVLKEAVNAIVVVGTKTNAPERETGSNGKEIVSKVAVPDCDGSGHGYYVITYADGSVDYQDY